MERDRFKKATGNETEVARDPDYDPRPLYEKLKEAREQADKEAVENDRFSTSIWRLM
jgi:uncharacterized protein (DUF2249 family)